MKIRHGFVSNSSSSSYIVIDHKSQVLPVRLDEHFVLGQSGECEFGWQSERYCNLNDKINFAYLQALHCAEHMQMLICVLSRYGAKTVDIILGDSQRWAYIDHQSSAVEGQNTEMFDDEESLERFLFCAGSYIQGGNDNSGTQM